MRVVGASIRSLPGASSAPPSGGSGQDVRAVFAFVGPCEHVCVADRGIPAPHGTRCSNGGRSVAEREGAGTRAGGRTGAEPSSVDLEQVAELRQFIFWLVGIAAPVAAFEGAAGVLSGDPRLLLTALTIGGYAIWLVRARQRLLVLPGAPIVHRLAAWMFAILGTTVVTRPSAVEIIAVATLLPVAVALPFLGRAALRRLMALAWLVTVLAVGTAGLLPDDSPMPPELRASVQIVVLAAVFALVLWLLWQFATRLKETTGQLQSLVAMSSDLGQTLEPRLVGDLMARHLADAVGADECGICFWDQPSDRVLTYGYYPVERRAAVDETYDLIDYPLTKRILEDGTPVVIDLEDPASDPHEVAYLRSLGQASMAMIPLIKKGRSIGLVELTSSSACHFDRRRVALAQTMAAEAAIALENARLHDELRRLAYHDPVTGLPNRALFVERLEAALPLLPKAVAVLFIDVDDFKRVNDALGHDAGDRLLGAIAERLRGSIRATDTAARIGGDEFGVLLVGSDLDGARTIADQLLAAVSAPVEIAGATLRPSLSIGIATASAETTARDLLRQSDIAMYRAKLRGKGRFEVFRPSLPGLAGEAREAEQESRGAA